jgi:hypothetical protein
MASAREDRQVAVRLGGAVALFLLLVGQAQVTVLDGTSMLAVAQSIVHHGSLSVPPELGVVGTDGAFYSKYGLLLPLLSVLPVALMQPVAVVTGRLGLLEGAAAATLMPLIAGALAAALFALGRRLGAPLRAAALVAAGTVLGTYLLPYGRDFFTEPLVALGLVAMVERALTGRELQAGAWLAVAVLARPQSAAFAPLLAAFLVARHGALDREAVRAVLRTAPPLVVAAAITVAYNLVRFGDALQFGYVEPGDHGFSTPLLTGAGGLLLSPEKSIVLFAPAIVLVPFALAALWRRGRPLAVLAVAIFATSFVLAATWWSWMGGWSWGPRLVIPGVAVVLATLGPWIGGHVRRLRAAAALFALGFVLSLSAVLAPAGAQLLGRHPGTDGPQLVRQVTLLPKLTSNSWHAIGDRGAREADYRRFLGVWQANVLRKLGTVGWPLAILGTGMLLALLTIVVRRLYAGLSTTRPDPRPDFADV